MDTFLAWRSRGETEERLYLELEEIGRHCGIRGDGRPASNESEKKDVESVSATYRRHSRFEERVFEYGARTSSVLILWLSPAA